MLTISSSVYHDVTSMTGEEVCVCMVHQEA